LAHLAQQQKDKAHSMLITLEVVFKDLQKLVSHSQQENTRKELFQRLQDKPFWIWDITEHKQEDIRTNGDCCFNHIIGLHSKDTVDKPLYEDKEGQIPWYQVLSKPSFKFGRSDPELNPLGYCMIMPAKLANMYYNDQNIKKRILGKTETLNKYFQKKP
jgi:hypothetical protein